MKRIFLATLVSYLAVLTAEGPWALAQAPATPLPAGAPSLPGLRPPPRRSGPLAALRGARIDPAAPLPPPPAVKPPAVKVDPKAAVKAAKGPADPSAAAGVVEIPGEKEFNSCKKLPAGKRIVRLNLKPDTEVMDLIGWISSITCAQFIVSVPVQGKKLTIVSPQLITPEEAYRLFFSALDSLGLTVEPTGKFLRVVENAKARFAPLAPRRSQPKDAVRPPLRDQAGAREYLDALDLTNNVLNRIKTETGDIIAYRSSLIITDQSDSIDRMVEIIKQFDTPSNTRDHIWVIRVKNMSVLDMASRISEIMPVNFLGTGQRRQGARAATAQTAAGTAGRAVDRDDHQQAHPRRAHQQPHRGGQQAVAHDWLVALVHKTGCAAGRSRPR
jgi:hypothetical protein